MCPLIIWHKNCYYTIMRAGFNLIELIFTIVIMAGVFSVIPKIIFATNKSDSSALKQDALFNAISLTKIASTLAWDENNTESLSILATSDNQIPCDKNSFLRVGGYLNENSRKCKDDLNASSIGSDGESDYLSFDDIDDFNDMSVDVNLSNKTKYKIYTQVRYLNDNIVTINGDKMTITLDNSTRNATSNIKKFKAIVGYVGGRGKDRNITSFTYYSTNIGQFTLDSEEW